MAMSINQYVMENDGQKCPSCSSPSIESGECNPADGMVTCEVSCTECGAKWEDLYSLTGYDNLTT